MSNTVLEKAKHTPGPWFPGTGWIGAGTLKNPYVVARVENYPYGPTEANAKLIAAAPELLDAAKDALESLRRLQDAEGAYRVTNIQQLETAIRKATE